MMQPKEIISSDDYRELVNQFIYLADKEFTYYEDLLALGNQSNLHEIALGIPSLISLTNVIGYFGGSDGVFSTDAKSREVGSTINDPIEITVLENPNDFQMLEDEYEKRLKVLIDAVMNSNERDTYYQNLKRYYLEVRHSLLE